MGAIMSSCKDPENRNKHKLCVCGGHNHNNPKKNLNNESTKHKNNIKKERMFKAIMRESK
jgi:hypothetical protein